MKTYPVVVHLDCALNIEYSIRASTPGSALRRAADAAFTEEDVRAQMRRLGHVYFELKRPVKDEEAAK